MKILLAFGIALFCIVGTIGCTPSIKSIELTHIGDLSPSGHKWRGVRIAIKQIEDARIRSDGLVLNGRMVSVEGNLPIMIKGALEEGVKINGGTLCLFDCPGIIGELLELEGKIVSDFPTSKLTVRVKIRLKIVGHSGKSTRTFEYRGAVSGEHPLYSEYKIAEEIGRAISAAIDAGINDDALINAIRSGPA